jgi:dihydrofolate reductase
MQVFVVTHESRDAAIKGKTTFTFVTQGLESALEQARAVAGDKNVYLMGANIAQQCLKAETLDEIVLHLVPVLVTEGIRLFDQLGTQPIELERTGVIEAPGVTHLRFRVFRKGR